MIDTHAHLNFQAFDSDWKLVVNQALDSGIEKMIIVGTDLESSRKAIDIAVSHSALFAAVGIHPHHVRQHSNVKDINQSLEQLSQLITHPQVVALGEIGLDYHYYHNSNRYQINNTPEEWDQIKTLQQHLFTHQLQLAASHRKPLIIHSREVGEDVLQLIMQSNLKLTGVFHCFEGSKKYLRRILEQGFFISFTGNITHVPDRAEVATLVPLNRLLLETDSPYMLPEPARSRGVMNRCEPKHVKLTAQFLAQLHHTTLQAIDQQTTINALSLFGI